MAEDINLFENVTCLEEKSDYRSDWQYLNKSDGNNDHIINSCTLSDEAEEVVDKLAKGNGQLDKRSHPEKVCPYLNFSGQTSFTEDLVSRYYQLVQEYDTLESRHLRTSDDLSNLHINHAKLKDSLEQKQRIISIHRENERKLRSEISSLTAKIKSDKHEILRLNSVIQMRDVQFQNDIRKRDIQIDKLKDKLTLFMNDGNIRKSGMSISGTLQRKTGSSRRQWNTDEIANKREAEVNRIVMDTYEARYSKLIEENKLMRDILMIFFKKLEDVNKTITKTQRKAGADDSTQSSELEAVTSTSCEETTSASSSVNENVRFVDGDFQLPFDHEMHFKCCTFINKKIATLKEVISFYTKSEQV